MQEQAMEETTRKRLVPGPDHPITIEPVASRVVVTAAGYVLADTARALKLSEANYPPVYYIPRVDVDMACLERTQHSSYCPYKGVASYFSIEGLPAESANAAWSYETPFDPVILIAGHLGFYPNLVDSIELLDP